MRSDSIETGIAIENFAEANAFVEETLSWSNISKEIRRETMLIFEALFHSLREQGFREDTILKINAKKSLGEININFVFEGEPFIPPGSDPGSFTPEDAILKAYEDKIDYHYLYGYNHIHIAIKRSYQSTLHFSLSAVAVAIVVYAVLNAFMSTEAQFELGENILFPIVKVFANAMLMVGAPVTFFSLLKNSTDIHILSEKNADGRSLQRKTVITSVITIILAIGAGFLIAAIFNIQLTEFSEATGLDPMPPLPELIETLVPSSIITPFETIMPFPLIFVALVATYAFCSVGKYFDKMKKAVDACYTLFSRMLHVVMASFPFFCFLALLYLMLGDGFDILLSVLLIIAVSIASLVIPLAFYLLRLLIGGVKLKPFLKHLPALLKENYKIGSAIDAVPYNIRFCARNYGMDRKRISDKFAILAEINLDGNCYLIMLMSMLFIFMTVSRASWYHIVVIAIMVLFLSFGAPNQPGSILIGTLIIVLFLKTDVFIPTAVYLEAFLGPFQNLMNVLGDVVTVAIEEKQVWSKPAP